MKFLQNQIPLTIPLGLIFSVISMSLGGTFYSNIRNSIRPFDIWNEEYYLLLIVIVSGISAIGMLRQLSWSRYGGLLTIGLLLGFFIWKNITEPPPPINYVYIIIVCFFLIPLLLFIWLFTNEQVIHNFENQPNKGDFDLKDENILDA